MLTTLAGLLVAKADAVRLWEPLHRSCSSCKHVRRYKSWSEKVGKSATSVAVLYASEYGFSDRLSQTLARGITKADVATEMVDMLSVDPQVGLTPCTASCRGRTGCI